MEFLREFVELIIFLLLDALQEKDVLFQQHQEGG